MKKNAAEDHARTATGATNASAAAKGKIHPVVIYPFRQPRDYADLKELYELIARLDKERDKYARPITVVDRKTTCSMEGNKAFLDFRIGTVAKYSDIHDAWCVDTCQMWYSGLGMALERGVPDDVYWLIPGDFNYGSEAGRQVLCHLHDLPEIIQELEQDLCIGEISTTYANPKQLIDIYGTFALLYTWFPSEAQQIRQYTERPRSEFFAVRHAFLRDIFAQRWFAYEQTMVMLLQAVLAGKRISKFSVGDISDMPEGKESLASAVQQVERAERVLKSCWRERNQHKAGWCQRYRLLESQSEQVRRAAFTMLENLLQ